MIKEHFPPKDPAQIGTIHSGNFPASVISLHPDRPFLRSISLAVLTANVRGREGVNEGAAEPCL